MKHIFCSLLIATISALACSVTNAQSPVGKSLHEIISLMGRNFNRLADNEGMHVLQYKRAAGKDTVADLIYLQGYTCVKEVSLRPETEKSKYIDSLNQQFKNVGFNSWRDKDSTFITISTRDGFLDITSFSAGYYNKIAH